MLKFSCVNVKIFDSWIQVDIRIYLKGEDQTDNIESYHKAGDRYIVKFSSGKTYRYKNENVRVVKSGLSDASCKDVFGYLKDIAECVGITIPTENGSELNLLSQAYSKIEFVDPVGLFCGYLKGEYLLVAMENTLRSRIYPFGLNMSQKEAVDKAMANRLSVIEGPPGTGKTQTILNIISNALVNHKTVAVVSSNNAATQNVLEKLEKHNIGFIAASLGSKKNKLSFIDSQPALPEFKEWEKSKEELEELSSTTLRLREEIEIGLQKEVLLSRKKQMTQGLNTEIKYFRQYQERLSKNRSDSREIKINSKDALYGWLSSEEKITRNRFLKFLQYLSSFFRSKGRIDRFIFHQEKRRSKMELITYFQDKFYSEREKELSLDISSLQHDLLSFDYNAKMGELTDVSLQILRASLAGKYKEKARKNYKLEDLKNDSEQFLKDFPVVISTTYSIQSSLSNDVVYDYLIIDEASQVDICTGALALSCAKNVVVVGDQMQLPNVVVSDTAKKTDEVFEKYEINEGYRYRNNSFLSSIRSLFKDLPVTLLKEHYRCHPKIIGFCNKKFYNNELIVMTEEKGEVDPLLVYKTPPGSHERNRMNQRQIDMIKDEIIPEQSLDTSDGSIGVVTPYRNQTNQLQKAFENTSIKADTVDKFQGQEKKTVILSTVDNDITPFTDNPNRLNVAVSRAVDQLIVVVNESDSIEDTNIGDLIKYIEYNNFTVKKSKVNSVFDLLYKSYAKERRTFLSARRSVSRYDSENLMFALIEDVLGQEKYRKFDVALHVPLRMVFRDMAGLNDEQRSYACHFRSHIDFLIFEKMGNTPMLGIEVDGVAFHKDQSTQRKRDDLKDSIFSVCGLPLVRFRTDGSREKEKLEQILEGLF